MDKINKNPAKAFLQGKNDGHNKGVIDGFLAYSYLAIIAGYNAWDGETEEYAKFFKRWEKECQRIFDEQCDSSIETVTEILLGKVSELRKRFEMEGVDIC